MKKLYAAANLPEAHLLREELGQIDVRAHIFNQNAQSAVGELPFTHAYPEIWIERDCDYERARLIVERYERESKKLVGEEAEIACKNCGEENPATFQSCWSCANDL